MTKKIDRRKGPIYEAGKHHVQNALSLPGVKATTAFAAMGKKNPQALRDAIYGASISLPMVVAACAILDQDDVRFADWFEDWPQLKDELRKKAHLDT